MQKSSSLPFAQYAKCWMMFFHMREKNDKIKTILRRSLLYFCQLQFIYFVSFAIVFSQCRKSVQLQSNRVQASGDSRKRTRAEKQKFTTFMQIYCWNKILCSGVWKIFHIIVEWHLYTCTGLSHSFRFPSERCRYMRISPCLCRGFQITMDKMSF